MSPGNLALLLFRRIPFFLLHLLIVVVVFVVVLPAFSQNRPEPACIATRHFFPFATRFHRQTIDKYQRRKMAGRWKRLFGEIEAGSSSRQNRHRFYRFHGKCLFVEKPKKRLAHAFSGDCCLVVLGGSHSHKKGGSLTHLSRGHSYTKRWVSCSETGGSTLHIPLGQMP